MDANLLPSSEFLAREKAFYQRVLAFLDKKMGYTTFSPSQRLSIEFALRIQRQAEACCAISAALLEEEAFAYLRVPMEHLIHILYVLYGGPNEEKRSPDDLSAQFYAYVSKDRLKVMKQHPKQALEAALQKGMTEDQFNIEYKALDTEVAGLTFVFGQNSWHRCSVEVMVQRVLKHIPHFLSQHDELWQLFYTVFRLQSSRLHPNPVGNRMLVVREDDKLLLIDSRSPGEKWANAAILYAFFAWTIVGHATGNGAMFEAFWKEEVDQAIPPAVHS